MASDLRNSGSLVMRVGAEPVFDLDGYFSKDPFEFLPLARALQRRGYRLVHLDGKTLSESETGKVYREAIARILKQRSEALQAEHRADLGFLSGVDPLFLSEEREYFFVISPQGASPGAPQGSPQRSIEAYASFQPLYREKQVIGYFASEYFRGGEARAGVIEFLLVEAMRWCANQRSGLQVRLGLVPFAKWPDQLGARVLARVLERFLSRPINPRGIRAFKSKLRPTRWEPLYVAVADRLNWALVQSWIRLFVSRKVVAALPICTTAVAAFCAFLHYSQPSGGYENSGYRLSAPDFWGWLSGPFFHNHDFHLWGDLLSLLVLGGAYEFLRGSVKWIGIAAAGLWLSNPITHLLILPGFEWWKAWGLWNENSVDYGSSNAVYALVGALASVTRAPQWLIVPFSVNALWVVFDHGSILAAHHWVALAMGWMMGRFFKNRDALPPSRAHRDVSVRRRE